MPETVENKVIVAGYLMLDADRQQALLTPMAISCGAPAPIPAASTFRSAPIPTIPGAST